jgi:glycosyltransferase involved in cell wall biosynthesis
MSVVIVDWLGRGGIAQCSFAWATELRSLGQAVVVTTRPGRELVDDSAPLIGPSRGPRASRGAVARLLAHRDVVARSARVIEHVRPQSVVVQGSVVPALETPVVDAAHRVGASLLAVIHNHRPHSPMSGSAFRQHSYLRRADEIVAHSQFVAGSLPDRAARVLPLPAPIATLAACDSESLVGASSRLLAVQFGVLKRRYKGAPVVATLARRGVPEWSFAAIGSGAPADVDGLGFIDRYVTTAELRATVDASAASLFPYRAASQSAGIVLSQWLGSVPVATAVGGVIEQIDDGRDGLLLPVGAGVEQWVEALARVADDGERAALVAGGSARARRAHEAFRAGVTELVGVPAALR